MALRAYVKPIGDKVFYRVEQSLTPNKPIKEALDSLRREVIIDSTSFKLEVYLSGPLIIYTRY
jgi:hypothetical protein